MKAVLEISSLKMKNEGKDYIGVNDIKMNWLGGSQASLDDYSLELRTKLHMLDNSSPATPPNWKKTYEAMQQLLLPESELL